MQRRFLVAMLLTAFALSAHAQRARDQRIPFEGLPGPLNAFTCLAGVVVVEANIDGDTSMICHKYKWEIGPKFVNCTCFRF